MWLLYGVKTLNCSIQVLIQSLLLLAPFIQISEFGGNIILIILQLIKLILNIRRIDVSYN